MLRGVLTATDEIAVSMRSLSKPYVMADGKVEVLRDVNLDVFRGDFVTVCGASGAGKTALLNLVSGIDKPSTGRISVFGEDLREKDEDSLSDFRCKIGFVLQSYNLGSTLTLAENIAFRMEWSKKTAKEIEERVGELLETLGLQHCLNHFPAQLSGGEQQRTALVGMFALSLVPAVRLAKTPILKLMA